MDYPAELFANPFRRRGHRVYLHTSRRPGNREELRERGTQEDGNFRRGLIFVFVLADSPPEADELINTDGMRAAMQVKTFRVKSLSPQCFNLHRGTHTVG